MATKTDTPNSVEEQDSAHNVAQDLYDREFNSMVSNYSNSADDAQENENIAKGTHKDDYGDTVQDNPNADVKEREEDGDSLYNQNDSTTAKGAKSKISGGLQGKLKKGAPTGGIIGLMLFGIVGMGGGSVGLASTMLVNLKEIFHNDRSDGTRTNRLFSRAFISNKFDKDKPCTGSKIKCKMTSMSRDQIRKFKEMGFKIKGKLIRADGSDTGQKIEDDKTLDPDNQGTAPNANAPPVDETTRGVITDIETPQGDTAKNGKELYALADDKKKSATLRALERAFPSKASFYLNKYFDNVLGKWKFTKGQKTFPENNDKGEQDKAFDEQTNEQQQRDNYDPNNRPSPDEDDNGRDYSSEADTRTNDVTSEAKSKKEGGSVTAALIQGVCSGYKVLRGAEMSIKLYHYARLGAFALMFFQAADEIKDGRGSGPKTTYLSDNLTYYESNKTLDKDTSYGKKGEDNPKYNQSATDSDGYKTAAYGDSAKLKAFAAAYTLGGASSIGSKIAKVNNKFDTIIGSSAGLLPGINGTDRQKAKQFCRYANGGIANVGATCIGVQGAIDTATAGFGAILGGVVCACALNGVVNQLPVIGSINRYTPGSQACTSAEKLVANLAQKAIGWASENLGLKELLESALKSLDVNSDTKGVDAGNAIAAGAGLMLSTTASGYGMKPASKDGDNKEVSNYIAYTQPLEDRYIALEKEDAKNTPLDATNQYSMLGTLVRSFDLYSATPTSLLGNASTLASAIPSAVNSFVTGQSVSALYNQPSQAQFGASGRYSRCDDEDLKEINATGDSFCSTVNVNSIDELNKAQEVIDNPKSDSIDKLIDYMQQKGSEGEKAKQDTADYAGATGSCTKTKGEEDEKDSQGICEASKQASIDNNGAPVPDSQYHKYLVYCTDQRTDPWGAQAASYDQGTDRDQDWYSGKECMKGDDNPDSSEGRMLKNFRAWTNYCLQSGTMDGTSNCYTDDAQQLEEQSNGKCGDGTNASIYECALKYDPWGYGPYPHGQDVEKFSNDIAAKKNPLTGSPIKPGDQIIDCSGLVRLAVWDAFKIDIEKEGGAIAPQDFEAGHWTKVDDPATNAKKGDVITFEGHVEIIESTDGKTYKTFGSHSQQGGASDISPSAYPVGGSERGVFRFKK